MTIERFMLIAISAFSIATVFYIPKNKFRLALISFLAFQSITWAATIIFVQIGSIEYPVRVFMRATNSGFLHNFTFIPMIFTWFILLFPKKSTIIRKVLHYIIFISVIVWFIYFISVFTDLEKINKGTPFSFCIRLYISFLVYFIFCHLYVSWFSKKENLIQE
ncbi:CBO0543 family protein [Paenibacillus cremeus]|uniref:Uncharacterized protein n=1 Tax=Paenibacillus cremeus TaxID=2163881 RepID=A0A559JFB3_9BACL|nr:hypothetical protein FPZ49_34435 [Paenibacillus cremeus]